jgi:hypothetical protein
MNIKGLTNKYGCSNKLSDMTERSLIIHNPLILLCYLQIDSLQNHASGGTHE